MMTLTMTRSNTPAWYTAHAKIRTDGYVILAALLRQPSAEGLIPILQNLKWDESLPEKVNRALEALRLAAHDRQPHALEKEYEQLFVGLGAGELVPYASWYLDGILASSALASLRADLMRLGIVSQADSHEPEDQAGALCEVMALLSRNGKSIPEAAQADFFKHHVASWMITFFEELQSAKAADFYRTVGLFGRHFLEFERDYLKHITDRKKQEVQDGTGI
jgi:TorA maturation chaperone TorD